MIVKGIKVKFNQVKWEFIFLWCGMRNAEKKAVNKHTVRD